MVEENNSEFEQMTIITTKNTAQRKKRQKKNEQKIGTFETILSSLTIHVITIPKKWGGQTVFYRNSGWLFVKFDKTVNHCVLKESQWLPSKINVPKRQNCRNLVIKRKLKNSQK